MPAAARPAGQSARAPSPAPTGKSTSPGRRGRCADRCAAVLEIGSNRSSRLPTVSDAAEKQDAAFAQREMEQREDLLLRLGAQIDQEIAAGDQVEARERRIGQHILRR